MNRLVLALPLVLVLTAACGDDGGDKGSSGVSRSEYLAKVEPICKEANAKVEALPAPSTPGDLVTTAEQVVAIAEKATTDFKAVEPPAADRADIQAKVVVPLEKQIVEAKSFAAKAKAAIAANDQAALGALVQTPPVSTQADLAWMRTFGFKDCVEAAQTDS
jgi:hypothetical protein